MNYLVVNVDCELRLDKPVKLKANVPYQIVDAQNELVLCLSKNQNMYTNFYALFGGFATTGGDCFSFKSQSNGNGCGQNCQLVQFGVDKYLFLFFTGASKTDYRCFEFDGKQVFVAVGESLIVDFAGEQVVNKNVDNISFSHFEIDQNLCCIFFEGERNFLVALNKTDLVWADYFDEYNCDKDKVERQVLKHLCDGLNHGRVLNLKEGKDEKYLVYLDDYELNLKPKFVALIFMDCLLAGNYKYCANLVDKSLKFDEANIKQFFPVFDAFFPLNATNVVLFKKNALVGICGFEVVEDKIINITIS